jgi:hypothetical protein
VGMWESRVLCEISKVLWKSFCDFHRTDMSTAAQFVVFTSSASNRGIVDPGRRADRRSWAILCGRCQDARTSCPTAASFPHAIALPLRGDHGRVMREAVKQGGSELFIAGKHRHPFGKCEIRGDDCRPALVAIGDQVEEQLTADTVEGHEAQFVDDEDVDAQEPLLQPRELAPIPRFEQLTDEIGRAREEYAPFLLGRFDAERDREMRFPFANWAGEDQILGRGDRFRWLRASPPGGASALQDFSYQAGSWTKPRRSLERSSAARDNSGHVAAITMRDPGQKEFRSSAVTMTVSCSRRSVHRDEYDLSSRERASVARRPAGRRQRARCEVSARMSGASCRSVVRFYNKRARAV